MKEFEEALKKAGKKVGIKIREGAGHGFFNGMRALPYHPQAAAHARGAHEEFLARRDGKIKERLWQSVATPRRKERRVIWSD
jgi:dienelactone hydrolase